MAWCVMGVAAGCGRVREWGAGGVNLPPEIAWAAKLAVGQDFPKGDEDRLHDLGDRWHEAAQDLTRLVGQVDPATAGVLAAVGGQVGEEYQQFTRQMATVLP